MDLLFHLLILHLNPNQFYSNLFFLLKMMDIMFIIKQCLILFFLVSLLFQFINYSLTMVYHLQFIFTLIIIFLLLFNLLLIQVFSNNFFFLFLSWIHLFHPMILKCYFLLVIFLNLNLNLIHNFFLLIMEKIILIFMLQNYILYFLFCQFYIL